MISKVSYRPESLSEAYRALVSKKRVPDLTHLDMQCLKSSMGECADATKMNALELLHRIGLRVRPPGAYC